MNPEKKECRQWYDKREGEGRVHLESCEHCRAARNLLAMGRRDERDHGILPDLDELAERRLVDAVIASVASEVGPVVAHGVSTRARKKTALIAAAALLAVGLVVGLIALNRFETVDRPVPAGTSKTDPSNTPVLSGARFARVTGDVTLGKVPSLSSTRVPLDTPIRSREGRFVFTLPSKIVISVGAHSEIVVTDDRANGLTVAVTRGQALFSLAPGSTRPGFRVATHAGDIHVLGTVFTVVVDKDDTQVVVHRGSVEARPRIGKTVEVCADQAFLMRSNELRAADSSQKATMHPIVQELVALGLGDHLQSLEVPGLRKPAEGSDDSPSHIASQEPPAAPSLKMLMAQARSAKSQGNWNDASNAYAEILSHYPGSDDANTVRVALGQLLLDHLDRPRAALSHLNRYLWQNPSGPLVPEALYHSSRCQRLLGNPDAEQRLLNQLITQYPDGLHASSAIQRLNDLK